MSVKRYKLRPIFLDYTSVKSFGKDVIDTFGKESAYEHEDGDYVRYDDYAALKAEVERFKFTLEEERQITRQDWAGLRCEHDRVKRTLEQAEAEVERLTNENGNNSVMKEEWYLKCMSARAEVERLRNAGDAVSLCLEAFWKGKPYDTSTNIKCFDAWNSAKEGKPQS